MIKTLFANLKYKIVSICEVPSIQARYMKKKSYEWPGIVPKIIGDSCDTSLTLGFSIYLKLVKRIKMPFWKATVMKFVQ